LVPIDTLPLFNWHVEIGEKLEYRGGILIINEVLTQISDVKSYLETLFDKTIEEENKEALEKCI
jgi:hypothetical protein